jgi:16S rRNA (cytidine1402-2'-O)-methyltransferase
VSGPSRAFGKGTLYLVPNLLGAVPPERVLPARTIEVARGLAHWIVETAKPARAFLKSLGLPRPVAECWMREVGEAPDAAQLAELLAPAREGHDVGLLSDAGCPGVADPGASVVAAAHAAKLAVVPLVGPSSLLLALMASGLEGQRFAFHGYLPADEAGRVAALRRLEADSRAQRATQLFIETPYRSVAMLASCVATLAPSTRLCVAADLTLPAESVRTQPVRAWRGADLGAYAKRPAIFLLQAE